MIGHLLKLVWNRKVANLLIVLEIFVSFLVVFAVTASGVYLYDVYSAPLGFDYQDVWQVRVERNSDGGWSSWSPEEAATFQRLLDSAESLDSVITSAGTTTSPYGGDVEVRSWDHNNQKIRSELASVTPALQDALNIDITAGRWFQPEDSSLEWTPIVIDQELADALFGDADPIGLKIVDMPNSDEDIRVIGVVRDYRQRGELRQDSTFTFFLADPESENFSTPLASIILKLKPGTSAAFEEQLVQTLQSVGRGWTFRVIHLDQARQQHLNEYLIPLGILGLVAGFLLAMVVLGLTGVMWQNVTRRTREFGLRRAIGAHRSVIHRQIVGEVMVTAGLGLIAGSFLALQVPLIGPFTFISYGVALPAFLVAAAVMLVLAAGCGLYPGWTATRIQPAEALHYE